MDYNDRCPTCNSWILGDTEVEVDEDYYYRIINNAISQFKSAIDRGIARSECRSPSYSAIAAEAVGRLPNRELLFLLEYSSGFGQVISPRECFLFSQSNRAAFDLCRTSVSMVCSDLIDSAKKVADDQHASHRNEGSSGGNPGGGSTGGGGTTQPTEPDYTKTPTPPQKPIDGDCFCVRGTPGQGVSGGLYGANRGKNRKHKGVDLGVNTGDPIYAVYSGKVTRLVTSQPDIVPKNERVDSLHDEEGYRLDYKGSRNDAGNRIRIYSEINGTTFETT